MMLEGTTSTSRMAGSAVDPFAALMSGTTHQPQRPQSAGRPEKYPTAHEPQLQQQPKRRQDRSGRRAASGRRVASAGPPGVAQMRGNSASSSASNGRASLDDEGGSAGKLRPLRSVQSAKERRQERPGSATPTMETYTRELFGEAPGGWTPRAMEQLDEFAAEQQQRETRAPLKPSATTNSSFTQNVGLVKPMESGIDLGAPDAHAISLLRTHELEMERVIGTIEVLRRACDDERATKKEAQTEARKLRTEMATFAKGREGDGREETKLQRRVAQLEKQLDLTKSKLSKTGEHARELSNGLADAQRDRRQLEKECRKNEELLKRSEGDRAELSTQVREANQARMSLASRLEKVVPAYAAAKENWGQQKRELVRHVEHYRKASLRSHAMYSMPEQQQNLQEQQEQFEQQQQEQEERTEDEEQDAAEEEQAETEREQQEEEQGPTDIVGDYAMTKDPNYQLMAYVNELVLENQKLKGELSNAAATAEPTAVVPKAEAGTDMSEDAGTPPTTARASCSEAGTETPRVATVDLGAAGVSVAAGSPEAVDANRLLEQLQQQLEDQLEQQQQAEQQAEQQLEAEVAAAAAAADLASLTDDVVATVATEAVTETAALQTEAAALAQAREVAAQSTQAVADWEQQLKQAQAYTEAAGDPYSGTDDEFDDEDEENEEEEGEEPAEDAAGDHYSQLLSSPPAAPAGSDGSKAMLSPPTSVPREPAMGRYIDATTVKVQPAMVTTSPAAAGVVA